MTILPLPNSQNPANFPNIEAAEALEEAIQTLQDMFEEYFNPVDGINNGGYPIDCIEDECCLLEFFYYYNPALVNIPAFINAIWVRINQDNDRWLFILVNALRKKSVKIFSAYDLGCRHFPQNVAEAYSLPPNFDNPPAWIENRRVQNITYEELMGELMNRLECVC